MEINPFVSKLQTLIDQEDLLNLGREAQDLKTRFDDFILEEERKDQVNALNAAESGEVYENLDFSPLKQAFYELYDAFKTKRNQQKTLKEALEKIPPWNICVELPPSMRLSKTAPRSLVNFAIPMMRLALFMPKILFQGKRAPEKLRTHKFCDS